MSRASVLVAVVSAVGLAATAALTAGILWQDHEQRGLAKTADSLATAIQHEAAEGGVSIERAAPDAIEETVTLGYRVEVWRGSLLVARNTSGRLLGPFPLAADSNITARWLLTTRHLPDGTVVAVAIAKERSLRSVQIFERSLLLSLPLCLLLAVLVGRHVGRRATLPLLEFTEQISRIRELRKPELTLLPNAPAEVRALECSFQSLLDRLRQSLARELEFAGNASHELRTPLTRIRLHAERALQDTGPRGAVALSAQLREIDRMTRLVDALLVLARDVEEGISIGEGVNLCDVVRDRAKQIFGDSIIPELAAPDEAMVRGDENLLSIAVENLLDNARKYTPAGLRPRVVVSEGGSDVRLVLFSPGVPMTEEVRGRLFERFFRGDEARASREGQGLGLSLARHIAELHGGSLFSEEAAEGATEGVSFVLALPRWLPGSTSVV